MPLSDWELWACANEMIRQYGGRASVVAAMRADKLAERHDEDGARTWRAIIERISVLIADPAEGEIRH